MSRKMYYKNLFGAATDSDGQGLDLQRVDLWRVRIELPSALDEKWIDSVEFAVEKFPFPARDRNFHAVKYMQQTNWQIGADADSGPVDLTIRYAFNAGTIRTLEKWFYLIANPETGGVGLTSQCKAMGEMVWLQPNQDIQNQLRTGKNTDLREGELKPGARYKLEGILLKSFKYADADMTQSTPVSASLGLSIDRWYPMNLHALT